MVFFTPSLGAQLISTLLYNITYTTRNALFGLNLPRRDSHWAAGEAAVSVPWADKALRLGEKRGNSLRELGFSRQMLMLPFGSLGTQVTFLGNNLLPLCPLFRLHRDMLG